MLTAADLSFTRARSAQYSMTAFESTSSMTVTKLSFSVVIPLYNKRLYIRRAVESVLSQTASDFELLVVDDGSTDGSVVALEDIDDDRLRIITQVNRGAGPARNTGMDASRSCYIAFLDADDAWLPGHLAELRELSEIFPHAGLLATTFRETFSAEMPGLSITHKRSAMRQVDYFMEAARKIGLVWSSSAAIKAEVYGKIGGFINVRAGEDLEYWARVALHYPVAVSDKVTCLYFRGIGGVMETIAHEQSSQQATLLPERLQDVSPSVAMLCERALHDQNLLENPSIHAYINGRLSSGIPGSIYRGEYALARRHACLMMKPLTVQQRCYRFVSELPAWFLDSFRSAYGWYRWINR